MFISVKKKIVSGSCKRPPRHAGSSPVVAKQKELLAFTVKGVLRSKVEQMAGRAVPEILLGRDPILLNREVHLLIA